MIMPHSISRVNFRFSYIKSKLHLLSSDGDLTSGRKVVTQASLDIFGGKPLGCGWRILSVDLRGEQA
jgi:hypothetical protein